MMQREREGHHQRVITKPLGRPRASPWEVVIVQDVFFYCVVIALALALRLPKPNCGWLARRSPRSCRTRGSARRGVTPISTTRPKKSEKYQRTIRRLLLLLLFCTRFALPALGDASLLSVMAIYFLFIFVLQQLSGARALTRYARCTCYGVR